MAQHFGKSKSPLQKSERIIIKYERALKFLAKEIARITKKYAGLDPTSIDKQRELIQALRNYSVQLEPWILDLARRILKEVEVVPMSNLFTRPFRKLNVHSLSRSSRVTRIVFPASSSAMASNRCLALAGLLRRYSVSSMLSKSLTWPSVVAAEFWFGLHDIVFMAISFCYKVTNVQIYVYSK